MDRRGYYAECFNDSISFFDWLSVCVCVCVCVCVHVYHEDQEGCFVMCVLAQITHD